MKNFVQEGSVLEFTAGGTITAGTCILVGSLLVCPVVSVASGAKYRAICDGVILHAKNSAEAWTEGVLLYWDAGNSVFTTTASTHKKVGVAARAADNPSATGYVKLLPGSSV